MNRYRFVAVIVALVVLGTAAFASGATGDPLILGSFSNEANKGTALTSGTEFGEATLTVNAGGGHFALQTNAGDFDIASTYIQGYSDALRVDGSISTDRAGVVVIPAGQMRITFVPFTGGESDHENPVQKDTLMIATVQGAGATGVLNVTLRPQADTATIRLTRAADSPVRVGWFTVRALSPL